MLALWRALQYHKPLQKFTTSLWYFVHWEHKRMAFNVRRQRIKDNLTSTDIADLPEDALAVSDGDLREQEEMKWERAQQMELMAKLPRRHRKALHQYYYEGRSVDEISTFNKWSRETTRNLLKVGVERLRELYEGESSGRSDVSVDRSECVRTPVTSHTDSGRRQSRGRCVPTPA